MASALSMVSSAILLPSSSSSSSSVCVPFSIPVHSIPSSSSSSHKQISSFNLYRHSSNSNSNTRTSKLICQAAEYKFPDPIPEFADSETEKFRNHLLNKLPKKDIYGDSVEEIVGICTEILSTFLHTEYGGPGTLLVVPFIDMADTINERGLPGGPQAARAAVKWGQAHIDNDWKEWNSGKRADNSTTKSQSKKV